MLNIYEMAVASMPKEEIDHDYSSTLYLKVTEVSKQLVKYYDFKAQVSVFIDQISHSPWYEIPFGYTPYWEEKCGK